MARTPTESRGEKMSTGSIPWNRIFAEGATIVVSILFAFGIDAWWDGRNDRLEERGSLRQLLAAFELNDSIRATDRQAHITHRDAASALLRLASTDNAEILTSDVNALLRDVSSVRSHAPASGSLNALNHSGRFQLIRNSTLRVALSARVWRAQAGSKTVPPSRNTEG